MRWENNLRVALLNLRLDLVDHWGYADCFQVGKAWVCHEFIEVLIIDFGHLKLSQIASLERLEQFLKSASSDNAVVNIKVYR